MKEEKWDRSEGEGGRRGRHASEGEAVPAPPLLPPSPHHPPRIPITLISPATHAEAGVKTGPGGVSESLLSLSLSQVLQGSRATSILPRQADGHFPRVGRVERESIRRVRRGGVEGIPQGHKRAPSLFDADKQQKSA